MAKKISQLTQATEVKSDDVTVIVQDGETKKLPLNMMVTKQDIENKKIAGLAKLDEIEATYENDTYTPTITVKNKSSVKTGEGDEVDYSANVMDGHVKSAILTGQTLVNLSTLNGYQTTTFLPTQTYIPMFQKNVEMYKPNTKYLVIVEFNHDFKYRFGVNVSHNTTVFETTTYIQETTGRLHKCILTTKPDFTGCNIGLRTVVYNNTEESDFSQTYRIMILEYQDGMENWDIPYFTGMQSVKVPVLSTTGKNLFDKTKFLRGYYVNESTGVLMGNGNNALYSLTDFIEIQPNKTLTNNNVQTNTRYAFYDKNKTFINGGIGGQITSPSNARYLRWSFAIDTEESYQIEYGTSKSSYEPYKSNILTVNDDVTLRGIGDVKDTLDCLTGEVTERIGEIVLDGSENWNAFQTPSSSPNHAFAQLSMPQLKTGGVLSENFPCHTRDLWGTELEGFYVNAHNMLQFNVQKSKLSEVSLNGLKNYIRDNSFVLSCVLNENSVKTVDLMPSGTHPSTTPYCWKNGHIQLSSSGLLPNLEYSVVTSRAGQINQNATMIVKNDKRIFDLEILLAGGLVNTTYQALTLQNQVETGLSKVSLNSETEPDYLLYHMIMKLIEEKAYKLDDLTEKVSVFYLYEKLSDEQFETIYSALYPFVEDEIVEEPVVEELPEVVEDEVIM